MVIRYKFIEKQKVYDRLTRIKVIPFIVMYLSSMLGVKEHISGLK